MRGGSDAAGAQAAAIAAAVEKAVTEFLVGRDGGDDIAGEGQAATAADAGEGKGQEAGQLTRLEAV